MGTRHLIRVIDPEGTLRIAQYGQWDGYIEGAGKKILDILRTEGHMASLREVLPRLRFPTWEMIEALPNSTMVPPHWSRDAGAQVLTLVVRGWVNPPGWGDDLIYMRDENDFGRDTVMCEWLYEIDFQRGEFRVKRNDETEDPMVWPLQNLPDEANFVKFTALHFYPQGE